ncbi:hypothetical protein ACLOJK_035949 [Asimina triloba]
MGASGECTCMKSRRKPEYEIFSCMNGCKVLEAVAWGGNTGATWRESGSVGGPLLFPCFPFRGSGRKTAGSTQYTLGDTLSTSDLLPVAKNPLTMFCGFRSFATIAGQKLKEECGFQCSGLEAAVGSCRESVGSARAAWALQLAEETPHLSTEEKALFLNFLTISFFSLEKIRRIVVPKWAKMKFMKLGSKPDSFQTDENNARYVATELATDFIVNVGDVKFHLHKFPLLSKCSRLHKLMATGSEENDDEIHIPDIPGGPSAFEICAKFCYGMTVTLNAYNVVAARCAAEYLEMHESVEKGNLIYKIEVFLNSGIFRSWKDTILVLQTTKPLLQWCEDLKIVGRCIDSIASRASIDTSNVEWSYTYNRKKLPSEIEPHWDGVRKQPVVPNDWWVEDLCELKIAYYKRVLNAIKTKDRISNEVIGEALQAYALRWIPGFSKGEIQGGDIAKNQFLVETIVWLLPKEKGSVPCKFLLKLLKAACLLDSGDMVKKELVKRTGRLLEEASVKDLLIPAPSGDSAIYDINLVQGILEEFVMQGLRDPMISGELHEMESDLIVSDASKLAVAKLVDGYLAEVSRDPNLPLSKFIDLAEKVGRDSRVVHDGLYSAIDMYLKEHPGLTKAEKRRICQLMDCKKLSMEACMHAAQNERLPLRVVVQVLFFEQVRAAASTGNGADLPMSIRAMLPSENSGSHGSSRSATTNTEDDWEASAAELKALKGELASMRLPGKRNDKDAVKSSNDNLSSKVKGVGIFKSKTILKKILSNKAGQGENSGSDTSDSPVSGSANQEDNKSTPSRNRRFSVSPQSMISLQTLLSVLYPFYMDSVEIFRRLASDSCGNVDEISTGHFRVCHLSGYDD